MSLYSERVQIDPDYEGPYPCIPITCNVDLDFSDHNNICLWFADDLALTHNVIIRGLNSIWLNAPLVWPEDEADFIGYCLACVDLIRAHHKAQETIIFPLLQEKVDMRTNVVQHLMFESPLHDFEVYLQKVRDKLEPFDNFKLLELRNAFGPLLAQHLHDEISTVSPKRLAAFTEFELRGILRRLEDHHTRIAESPTLLPFILTHHNKWEASKWPNVTSDHAVHKWVSNHVSHYLHRNYWKFSPYSSATGDFQTYPPREFQLC